ncbi:hypothetical protein WMY93_022775 [Mugilogobius chulae]|uniref:Pyrroline-5-carboxylate reductase catalytic N-terminal domain-containing protein n=1 Tax=Mugilogobius chulae TaxID=88201 RepID=A0AAW0N918_9GOBI
MHKPAAANSNFTNAQVRFNPQMWLTCEGVSEIICLQATHIRHRDIGAGTELTYPLVGSWRQKLPLQGKQQDGGDSLHHQLLSQSVTLITGEDWRRTAPDTFLPRGPRKHKLTRQLNEGTARCSEEPDQRDWFLSMPDDMAKPLIRERGSRLLEASQTEPGSPLVVVGSRSPKRSAALFPEEVEVASQLEAASQADLLFVALFPEHYSTLVELKQALGGKVLVDVSNGARLCQDGPSNAEQLADMFPESHVVKGFNTVSAWALQNGPRDGSRQVFLCSDSSSAKSSVSQLCRRMGFVPVDMGLLSSSLQIENMPLHLFPLGKSQSVVFCPLCIILPVQLHPGRGASLLYIRQKHFYKMPIELVNVTLPCVALLMLTLVYVPGLCAAFFSCGGARSTSVSRTFWTNGLEDGVVRVCGDHVHRLLSLLAVTSLPSVANTVNWREFSFIQSTLGHCALFTSTLHTCLYGWTRAFDPGQYRFYLPPTFLLVVIFPVSFFILRSLLFLPCVALRLRKIRRGWEKSRHIRFTLPDADCRNGLEDVSHV